MRMDANQNTSVVTHEQMNHGSLMHNATLPYQLRWYFLPTAVLVPPLGIPANALVIRLLVGKPGICSTSEIFTLNLAMFDMLFCLALIVEYARLAVLQTMESGVFCSWALNQAGGPMLLCFLGWDSYLAVCHPLVFIRLKDPRLRLSLCFLTAAITVTCCAVVKFSSKSKWAVLTVMLSVSIAIISTFNVVILKSLRKSGPNRKEVHPLKKRAFKIVLTAFLLVIVHYVPPLAEYLLKEFGPDRFRPYSWVTSVCYLTLSMSSILQPLSYLARTKQLPRISCGCRQEETVETLQSNKTLNT